MNNEEQNLHYEILDEEISTLEKRYKLYYMELGRALEKMSQNNVYREGGFSNFYSYVKKRTNFTTKRARALRGVFNEFSSLMDPNSHQFDSRFPPKRNKLLGRIIMREVGWSKAREIKRKKDKFEEPFNIGLLDLEEVLFYGSLVTKEKLIHTLERYETAELAIRVYCKVYFPELLNKYKSVRKLYRKASEKISKKLAKEFTSDFFEDMSNQISNLEKDKEKDHYIFMFKHLRKLESSLLNLSRILFIYDSPNFNNEPLTDRVLGKEPELLDLSLDSALMQLRTLTPDNSVGSCGVKEFAYTIGVDIKTAKKWINNETLKLASKMKHEDLHTYTENKPNSFNVIRSELDEDEENEEPGGDWGSLIGPEDVEVLVFTLTDIVKGTYLKSSIESGDTLEEAIPKVERKMSLIEELDVLAPYLLASKKLASIAIEDVKDGIMKRYTNVANLI